jgi:sodium-dependent dicarboxylate transporter 2/3/5
MMRALMWSRVAGLGARQRLGLVLGPALFVLTRVALGGPGGLPLPAAYAAATVLLMATWWITEPMPLWATALIPLVVFPVTGAAPLGEVVPQYLDPVNFLFLGGMWIAASMEQWGLHRRLALGIVARIGTSPRRIVLGFMLATAFISLWISNTAAALMMFPIAMAVLDKFACKVGKDAPELRRFGAALMLGLAYAASMGGVGSKIGTGTNLVFVKEAARTLSLDVGFVTWFKIGLPIVIVAVPLAWLYLVRVALPIGAQDFPGGGATIIAERARLGPMGHGERAALTAFLSAAFLWIFRSPLDLGAFVLPGWSTVVPWSWADLVGRPVATLPPPFAELLGPRGAEGAIAMLIGIALLVTPVSLRPYRPALGPRQAAGISWGLLALLGGGFAMAHGIGKSGLSVAIADAIRGVSFGGPFIALVTLCLATIALSEVASNTATASILLPVLAVSAPSFGLPPATLMMAATLASSFGFMLPAGTPPNAVAFSSGYITVGRMARSGLVVDLAGGLLIAAAAYLLVPWVFGR